MKNVFVYLILVFTVSACGPKKKKSTGVSVGRTAAVVTQTQVGSVNDKSGFCEKTFPSSGPDARSFKWPKLRPLPGAKAVAPPKMSGRWTWVNLWATWCEPCMDEMGLLKRWTASLDSEGRSIGLALLTIDAIKDTAKLQAVIEAGLPGQVQWLYDPSLFDAFLEQLGVGRGAAIPIHALVDPDGLLRCVRVGAISALDFAAVKSIFQGG
ncbi:MAG: TlpA disulfide reductase family protein [Myxococcota bacterium]|nr:TlpA disulfide reductase family protein [Myxococcota bacterium]